MPTVVIMQPTYLPWLGYFDLMDQSDIFVFLDSVQFDKRSWQQRNRIKSLQGELLLTVPVLTKGRFDQKICDAELDQTRNFQDTHFKTIKCNYSKARYFKNYIDNFEKFFYSKHRLLADLNIDLIAWLKDVLGIKAKLLRSSNLAVNGKKTELLVDICKAVGADKYLSPAGSKDYIAETEIFLKNGVDLTYHDFTHPVYHQMFGDFLSHFSIIDLLFNEGDESLGIIRSGRRVEKEEECCQNKAMLLLDVNKGMLRQ